MPIHNRIRLADIEAQIKTLFEDAGEDLDALEQLEAALWIDACEAEKVKKMGRRRIYDKWGIEVGLKMNRIREAAFTDIPGLGIF